MMHHTPLRYPGGKRRLAEVVIRLLEENGLRDVRYAEPYTGGGAVALGLLFGEYASTVYLNDLSRPVFAFWHVVLNETEWLCKRICGVKVTMATWRRQREILRRRDSEDIDDLGFAALFLNRTNRSGIIRGGVIGGLRQDGNWSLGVRFNKAELVDRIRKIARYRDRIKLQQMDALEFTNKVVSKLGDKSFAFYDPPYIECSRLLYMNNYDIQGHRSLAERVQRLSQPWIVTYDFAAVRHRLYVGRRRLVYGLHYTAHRKHEADEVMYFSDCLTLPKATELVTDRMALVPRKSRLRFSS